MKNLQGGLIRCFFRLNYPSCTIKCTCQGANMNAMEKKAYANKLLSVSIGKSFADFVLDESKDITFDWENDSLVTCLTKVHKYVKRMAEFLGVEI